MATKKEKTLTFKDKPLIRNGNTLYYGSISDPYIALLHINDNQEYQGLQLPTRVSVQILSTDETLPLLDRIKKNTEKKSFYDALKIAAIWLDRILEDGDAGDDE